MMSGRSQLFLFLAGCCGGKAVRMRESYMTKLPARLAETKVTPYLHIECKIRAFIEYERASEMPTW